MNFAASSAALLKSDKTQVCNSLMGPFDETPRKVTLDK